MRRFPVSWTNTLTRLGFQRKPKKARRHGQRARFARVEPLEERRMLAVLTVDGTTDVDDGDTSSIAALLADRGADGTISLREAVVATNNTAGADTIVFDPLLFDSQKTITLGGTQLTISEDLTIEGPGAQLLSISGNNASRVFYVNSGTAVTLQGMTITEGKVTGSNHGGGIRSSGDLTLDKVVVSDNQSAQSGGGLYMAAGSVTIVGSTFDNNTAYTGGGARFHMPNGGPVHIIGSTFSNNDASNSGGGIFIWGQGTTEDEFWIVNSTFSANTTDLYGGGIRAQYQTGVYLVNSTIYDNHSGSDGGGISAVGSGNSVTAQNTIIAQNTSPSGPNYIVQGGFVGGSGNNITSGDPELAPLDYYGGLTKTHAPLPGSGAINTGNDAFALDPDAVPLDFDQRWTGYPRILGSAVDIGAVEAHVVQPTPSSAIVVYGTEGADGIYVGTNHLGQDVVLLDTVGGYEFPVDLGSAASLSIYALEGDDAVIVDSAVTLDATIEGGDGDDLLVGGGGDDTLRGGLGADTLHGGAGVDTLYGYLDSSTYLGGDGADSLFGDAGADVVWVEYGSDIYEVDLSDDVDGANAPALDGDTFETIIKDQNTGFGFGWDLPGVDQLVIGTDPLIRWVRPDGYLIDFDDYDESSSLDETASKVYLAGESNAYLRVDKFGNQFSYFEYVGGPALLTKSVNRLGVGYQYSYGSHGGSYKIETVSVGRPGQASETTTYAYGTDDLVDTVTDPFGRVTNLYYDTSNRLEQIVLPAPDSSAPTVRPTFDFEYDTAGFLTSVTDADGRETLFDMSGSGELTITYPDTGEVTQLPALGDAYNSWRSQLGAWAEYLPEFRFKFTLDEEERSGYEIDALGRTTTFEIDEDGYLTEMTDAAGQFTEYTRNAAGLPTRVKVWASGGGPLVSDTQYTYDTLYNLERIDYIDGTFETWDYDPDFSQVIEHVDQLGRTTLYEINSTTGNIDEMRIVVGLDDRTSTEDDDLVTLYEYEDDGLVKTVVELRNDVDGTPQLSFVTQYTYTDVSNGSPHVGRWLETITYGGDDPGTGGISLVNPSTIEITARNDYGMVETIEDELDRETTYEYDGLDRLIKVTSPDPLNSQDQPVVEYVYKLSSLLEEVIRTTVETPSNEITTHYAFDTVGRIASVIESYNDPDEAETFYDYDLAGNLTQIIDPLGHSTDFAYDVLNRPIRVTEEDPDAGGALAAPVTLLAYDALGRLLAERDPVNNLTRREYDQLGRLTKEFRPLGTTTMYVYDAAGQLLRMTDPQGRLTAYVYDNAGRMAKLWEPGLDAPTTYQYDTASNLRLITDPLSHTSERVYDERGRLTEAIDANEDSTLYTYTDANELETLTDAELNTTTWEYDGAGRVKSETNELEDARLYKYDGFGRLAEYTDRNGRVTKYTYDDLDQLATEKWYNGVNLARTITYDFDSVGNLLSISDPSATYEYDYDDLNRLTSVEQTLVGLTPAIVFETAYDAAGRKTSSTADIGGTADYANSYVYDALDRLASVTQTDDGGNAVSDKRVDFTYNRAGQLTSIDRYSNLAGTQLVAASALAYNDRGRLAELSHIADSTTIAEYGFTYDGANRLATFTNTEHSTENRTYTYDAAGQLVTAVTDYDPLVGEFYAYDDNGNRLYAEGYGVGPFPTFTIGDNNQLLSDGTYDYEYDNEGNLVKRIEIATGDYLAYAWDHRNRLTAVLAVDINGTPINLADDTVVLIVSNTYDPFNQVVRRFLDPDGTTGSDPLQQTIFVYHEGQIVLQFDDTGNGNLDSGDLSHRYLWAQAVDQLLADEVIGGDTLWALTDHLGTVRDVVDSNGTLRKHTSYDSFGQITDEEYFDTAGDSISSAHAEAIAQLFGYTGRPFDKATGLQNNLNRWYDASFGRWLSEDPIGFAAGDANLYRYVGNMPTMWVDPSGLIPDNPQWTVEKGRILEEARSWFKWYSDEEIKNNGKGWPRDNCEDQALSLDTCIGNKNHWKHWDVRGVTGWRWLPSWPPGYLLPRLYEAENAVGVYPVGDNPGPPFIIDGFHGYSNTKPDITVYENIEDFFDIWPRGRDEDSWRPKPGPWVEPPIMWGP